METNLVGENKHQKSIFEGKGYQVLDEAHGAEGTWKINVMVFVWMNTEALETNCLNPLENLPMIWI